MSKLIAIGLLMLATLNAYAAPGDITLDLGLGMNNPNSPRGFTYAGQRINMTYPSIDQARNPLFHFDLSYQWTKNTFVGFIHDSSTRDRDLNYGLNMLYIKYRFRLRCIGGCR